MDPHSESAPALPLTVLEATDSPGAAFAAALLGDFGADVTVVEPPGGSAIRRLGSADVQAVWWPIIGRNKRSLAVDPSRPAGLELLAAAVRGADVVFVDDSPQGLAVQALVAREGARAQVTRLHGTGADRPAQWRGSTRPEFAAAASGLMALTGWRDGPPMQPEFPVADASSGMLAALLALAELRHARRTGGAPHPVGLGLHEALLRMNEWQLAVAAVQGRPEQRNGNRFPMNWSIANIYRTRDGRLVTLSAATAAMAERVLHLVGGTALASDPRFTTVQGRRENMDALDAVVAAWMLEHDADEILRLTAEADVVVGPLLDADELLREPHVAARGGIVRLAAAEGRRLPMPAPLPTIDALPGRVRSIGPAPGEGADELLARLGVDEPTAQRWLADGALWALDGHVPAPGASAARGAPEPLPGLPPVPPAEGDRARTERPFAGLRVLEAGVVIAGPFAGSLLAELGAEVIKVEHPDGDPTRQMGVMAGESSLWWGVSARAKRCIALDLKSEAHRAVFLKLAEGADVLVENYRPGVLDRLGLGWAALRARNPRLVMLSVSGFGATGPYSHRPGFGKIAEAFSGMTQFTGESDDVAINVGVSMADTTSGLMGAFGVALALLHRDVFGGSGARVDVALYEALFRMCECQLALAERLGRAPKREGTNDPYGWGASGRRATFRAAPAADGRWLLVDLRTLPAGTSEADLAGQVASLDAATALARLATLGVEAAEVFDGATLASTPYFSARGDVLGAARADLGGFRVPGEILRRPSGSSLPSFRAPRVDEDAALLDAGGWPPRRSGHEPP